MDASGVDQPFPPEFLQMIEAMFPGHAEEVLAAMREGGADPSKLLAGLDADSEARALAFARLGRAFQSPTEGPVNWEMAHDLARQAAATGGDASITSAQASEAREALSVADLWLDEVTDFPAAGGRRDALSSAEWVEATIPVWRRLVDPIAASISQVLGEAITEHGRDLEDSVNQSLADMMKNLGGVVFGMQIGQAIGGLSREVFGLTDIGLALCEPTSAALLPSAIVRFSSGLDVHDGEMRLFLATREAAGARLFTHARWLPAHLIGAVEAYARGIEINVEAIEEAVRELDPADPQELRQALSSGVFTPARSPSQVAALARLETALALVEGWVDDVAGRAVAGRLPSAGALGEMIRRRRAAGGPAERAFATLVGLELRPRRAREARKLFALVAAEEGAAGRERLWSHPDLLPDAEELAIPELFLSGRAERAKAEADVDAAIAELLSSEAGDE
ncbi:MAG: zinc-dependent metalloprotease [Micrococcales bacterium]|nr:zinc-dependent metalloprotease [Micrococcales bacterium]